jgi:hypothetical protein
MNVIRVILWTLLGLVLGLNGLPFDTYGFWLIMGLTALIQINEMRQ